MESNANSAPAYFGAQCVGLTLFENASFVGYGLDSSHNVIMNKLITLTTDQYNEWKKHDDNYIIKLVGEMLLNETQQVVESEHEVVEVVEPEVEQVLEKVGELKLEPGTEPEVDPEVEQEIKQRVDKWVDTKVE